MMERPEKGNPPKGRTNTLKGITPGKGIAISR